MVARFYTKRASQEEACQLILHALGIAVDRNKRNYGYVNAILKSWEQQNYLSVHEVLVNDKNKCRHAPQMTEEYQELGFKERRKSVCMRQIKLFKYY